MELLAPVGNFDSLKVAIYNGANAIYFGVNKFNARNNIDGFSLEDVENIVNFCHLRRVKVYLAINILFKDEELQSALDVVYMANNAGVDAFIVQDLGFASLIKEVYPKVVIHASTQLAVHNLQGVQMLQELGFSRVVLSRETSLEEINHISKNSNIEIEFFVQGALCVSFSGNCYMSSYLCGKSGNRGLCAQYCRHCYDFLKDGRTVSSGFLLSAKDICLLDKLKDLKQAGVLSLKIEGRARRPFYVGQVCKTYRKVLDNNFKCTEKDYEDLALAFNREFTPAYFNGNIDIISNYSNHIGIKVGKVEKINFGRKFNEVFVKSKTVVNPKSVLKFYDNKNEYATLSPYDIKPSKSGFMFTTTSKLKTGLNVNLLNDAKLEEEILQNKKISIAIEVEAISEHKLKLKYQDLTEEYFVLEKSVNKSFSKIDCENCFNKNSEFDVKCNLITDGVFVLNSQINKVRNDFLEKIKNKIINNNFKINKLEKINKNIKINLKNRRFYDINKFNFKIIKNINEFNLNLTTGENIIYSPEIYNEKDILKFNELMNGACWYLDLPNYCTSNEIEFFNKVISKTNCGIVANNLSHLKYVTCKIGGSFLNVYNTKTIELLKDFGVLKFFIAELESEDVENLKSDFEYNFRDRVYMTLRFCPIKEYNKTDCNNCTFNNKYTYKLNSKEFKLKRKRCNDCTFYLTD